MRFDTEEAFFKATFRAAATSPSEIGDTAWQHINNDDIRTTVTNRAVQLMRGAFAVHQRCNGQLGTGDSLLGYRLEQAQKVLPEGWRLVVMVEKGALRVDLYDPDDKPRYFSELTQSASAHVNDALNVLKDQT
jgi:hypothetical protein